MKRKERQKTMRAPKSFVQALDQDWEIIEQLSMWTFQGANVREGFFRLKKKSADQILLVRYTALYKLGEPYFLEVNGHA